MEPEG